MYASGHVEGVALSARFDEPFVARQKARPKEVRANSRRRLAGVSEDERERTENGREARHDLGGLGFNLLTQGLNVALEKQLGRRLARAKVARGRPEGDAYGFCDVTGEPIPRPAGDGPRDDLHVGSAKATGGVVLMWELKRRRCPCER